MQEKKIFLAKMDGLAKALRDLEVLYERYFSGEEKREPLPQRAALEQSLRQLANRRIIQTDLRFRYETLAARYHSYATYWNRITRLIDEGRYQRQLVRLNASSPKAAESAAPEEKLYADLLDAHRHCASGGAPPDLERFAAFLTKQKEAIRSRYGVTEVEFRVVIEDGRPKIKARTKA